jgi:hypothetical protein
MLHGCRSDLILKCLVYSNKDRNFLSILIKTYVIDYFIYKINEMKMTSKSL